MDKSHRVARRCSSSLLPGQSCARSAERVCHVSPHSLHSPLYSPRSPCCCLSGWHQHRVSLPSVFSCRPSLFRTFRFARIFSFASSALFVILPFPAAARKLGEATSAPCCSFRILRAQTVRFILARLSDSPLQAPRGVRTPLTAPTVSLHHPLSPSILLRHFRHFSFFMPR